MKEGGIGGANTLTGMKFEKDTDLREALLSRSDITVRGIQVYHNEMHVGLLLRKNDLYREFFGKRGVNWKTVVAKRLYPDEGYFSLVTNTLTVLEKKYQQVDGSVDEKLQTCGFKKKQYQKLCALLPNVTVEYVYVLNDWFKSPQYRDVLAYIEEVGCRYYFNELPYELFGFTTPNIL